MSSKGATGRSEEAEKSSGAQQGDKDPIPYTRIPGTVAHYALFIVLPGLVSRCLDLPPIVYTNVQNAYQELTNTGLTYP